MNLGCLACVVGRLPARPQVVTGWLILRRQTTTAMEVTDVLGSCLCWVVGVWVRAVPRWVYPRV